MGDKVRVKVTVNGEEREFLCDPRQSLLECLRDILNLTGTKEGCNDGNCGICAVLLNGQLVNSCLVLGPEVDGQEVVTIEGLADWRGLHPIQQAFVDNNGYQCGYCTPGIIMAAKALLDQNPDPTEAEVRLWMSGNLCRCTGYDKLVRSVLDAAARMRGDGKTGDSSDGGGAPADGGSGGTLALPADRALQYRVIGTRPARFDAAEKVTGAAIFAGDIRLPGMLWGKVARSPYAHARIRSIDTSRAEALPGVKAVITAGDLWALDGASVPRDRAPQELKYLRDRCLAHDKVVFQGQAVAAVAAVDRYVAEAAAGLIEVEYEPLPPVMDVLEAMGEGAPLLHDDLFTESFGKKSEKASNVARHLQHLKGDPEKGFAESDLVLEHEVRTATVHQGYLEPPDVVARWGHDGTVTVWCSTQGLFNARDGIARMLNLPISCINLVPVEVGGGFGGKGSLHDEPLAVLLSLKAGYPVRLSMTRNEVLWETGPTPGSHIKVKMGVTRDGRIQAVTARMAYEAGGFPGAFIFAGARCILGGYDIPNGRIDAYDVVVNKPKSLPYRAPCVTQAAFAVETLIDEVCEKLGMDPLEFRLKNAGAEGTLQLDGLVLPRVGFVETIRAAVEHPHYRAPLGGPNRGRGVAAGWWFNNGQASSCSLAVNTDGTVNLATGSIDLQGTRTTIAMQAAEVLGIPLGDFHSIVTDTASTGFNFSAVGSRTTYSTGIAAIEAAGKVVNEMRARAALMWGVGVGTVSFDAGLFTDAGDSQRKLTFKEVAARQMATGGPIFASAAVSPTGAGSSLVVQIADVEVDPETGKIRVLRCTTVQDAGKAINPDLVEGQLQAGTAQGIGWALHEGYRYDGEGRLQNDTFLDYKMPTCGDVPMIDTVIVEVPNPGHPFGVRGVGETAITAPPAAIANAIYRVTGARIRQLPLSPVRILEATGVIE